MTAGNQPSYSGIMAQAGSITTRMRDLFAELDVLNSEITTIGGANGLKALPDATSTAAVDVPVLISTMGNLGQFSQVYAGAIAAAQFPYRANSMGLWGNQ
jgi:hypothetical protein